MKIKTLIFATVVAASFSSAVYAQGIVKGADEGIKSGTDAAGPVGGMVGGVVGGVTGGINGLFGIDERPRFHEYVVQEGRPSVTYDRDVTVGTVLPGDTVTYYDVPEKYGKAHAYKYAVVNHRTVLVEPKTHRVVEVLDN